ncbi:Uncharacterized protein PBTT_01053 [Plasmodiophora brassicae]
MGEPVSCVRRRIARWMLCEGSAGRVVHELHAAATGQLPWVTLHIDLMLMLEFDAHLGHLLWAKFPELRDEFEFVAKKFLLSSLFGGSPTSGDDTVEQCQIVLRVTTHPALPISRTYSERETGSALVAFRGLVISCGSSVDICSAGSSQCYPVAGTMRTQTISIILSAAETITRDAFGMRNQTCDLVVTHEHVERFAVGHLVQGIGALSISDIPEWKTYACFGQPKNGTFQRFVSRLQIQVVHIDLSTSLQFAIESPRRGLPSEQNSRGCPPSMKLKSYWREILDGLVEPAPTVATSPKTQQARQWAITYEILREFGRGVVAHELYDKAKLMLLLSLVSLPSFRCLAPEGTSRDPTLDVEVRDRVYWKRVSSSASVDYSVTGSEGSWKFSGDDENESEAISLLFLADDPQLSDLVNWAYEMYPSRLRLSLFCSANPAAVVPPGSLLLTQGNCLGKPSQLRQLKSAKSRSCFTWSLCPAALLGKTGHRSSDLIKCLNFYEGVVSGPSNTNGDDEVDSVLCGSEPTGSNRSASAQLISRQLCHFLDVCRSVSVRFGQECRRLIKSFFLVCRCQAQYPMWYLGVLIRFARAHARLHLRSTVEIVDVLVGIMAMEETRVALDPMAPTVLQFQRNESRPYALSAGSCYDGRTVTSRFLSFYAHVLEAIRKFDVSQGP